MVFAGRHVPPLHRWHHVRRHSKLGLWHGIECCWPDGVRAITGALFPNYGPHHMDSAAWFQVRPGASWVYLTTDEEGVLDQKDED